MRVEGRTDPCQSEGGKAAICPMAVRAALSADGALTRQRAAL